MARHLNKHTKQALSPHVSLLILFPSIVRSASRTHTFSPLLLSVLATHPRTLLPPFVTSRFPIFPSICHQSLSSSLDLESQPAVSATKLRSVITSFIPVWVSRAMQTKHFHSTLSLWIHSRLEIYRTPHPPNLHHTNDRYVPVRTRAHPPAHDRLPARARRVPNIRDLHTGAERGAGALARGASYGWKP